MIESKLTKILSTFSRDEMKSFEKFINSPYFSIGRDVSGLFQILKSFYPDFKPEKIRKEIVYKKLFSNDQFKEKRLKNLVFDLTRLSEQFLVHENVRLNENLNMKILAQEFKNRKQDKYFLSSIEVLEKKVDKLLIDRSEFFEYREEIAFLKEDYFFWKNDLPNSVKYRLENAEYFTLFFIVRCLQRMKDKIIINSRTTIEFSDIMFDTVIESLDFQSFIKKLRENNYRYSWLIEIYFYSYLCLKNEDEKNYHELKKVFMENLDKLEDGERNIVFLDLTYYCSKAFESGKRKFLREGFEIYKQMLGSFENSEKDNKFLHIEVFRNIVLACMNLKEYLWLKEFSVNYLSKLKPEFRESMKNYVEANLSFASRAFEEALEHISKIKYDIFLYKIDIKNLMLKIYYELGLYDQAHSLQDAYRHFLNENKQYTELFKIRYSNFLHFYSKLMKAKEKNNTIEADLIKKEIENSTDIAMYQWLLDKADEMVISDKK